MPNLTFKRAAVTSIAFAPNSATLDDGTRMDGETLAGALGREAPEAPSKDLSTTRVAFRRLEKASDD